MTNANEDLRAALLMITHKANEANIHRDEDDVLETIIEIARAALAAAPQPAPEQEMRKATEDAVVSVPKSLLLEVLEEAVMDSHATEHEFGGDAEPHRDRIASLQRLAAAPQPAPDRESLMEMIAQAQDTWSPDATTPAAHIADALLARGLRLPGAEETMAWAVIGEDGAIDPRKLWINSRDAEEYCERGERAVRVAIRVVEGGDDE